MTGTNRRELISLWDVAYAIDMGIACLIAYAIATRGLSPFVGRDDVLLGGMWAAVATVFVFRDTRANSLTAGTARLIATLVSFALCLPYFLCFPFTPLGMAVLLCLGTLIMMLLDRRDDIITTGITTTVVMVVAAISPAEAWQQPLLRLVDTVVGIAAGIAFKWAFSFLYFRLVPEQAK